MKEQLFLEHVRRAREGRVDIAIAHGNEGGDVAREVAVRARRARVFAASRQSLTAGRDLEVDLDRGGGVLGEIAVVRDHDRDGLADVADLVRAPARAACAAS